MENQLPKNWVETELNTVTLFMRNGGNFKQQDEIGSGLYPISRIETIAHENIDFNRVKYAEADEMQVAKYQINFGEILFSHINSDKHLGKTGIFTSENILLHGINLLLIRPNKEYNPFLLNYYFKYYRNLGGFLKIAQRAVNQSSINQKKLGGIPIPLPPLPEQKRIVAKLDALFVKHERMKQALARIPQLLKDFRQQILTQAVTGKLTEEWRKGKDLDEWKDIFLEKLCNKITDGEHFRPEVQEEGVYFLSAKDIRDDKIDLNSPLFISEENAKKALARCNPELNDILVVSRGATVGRMCIVNIKDVFCLLGSVILIKPKNDIVSKYLYFLMKSPIIQKKLFNISGATAQQAIYLRDIKKIIIPVSPRAEQEEIVRRVESLFAKADAIEARYQTLKEKIVALPQTILHKAFKGELVPQLPSDGDAKDLLAEILKLKKEAAK